MSKHNSYEFRNQLRHAPPLLLIQKNAVGQHASIDAVTTNQVAVYSTKVARQLSNVTVKKNKHINLQITVQKKIVIQLGV